MFLTDSLCLSQTFCVCHRHSVSVTYSLFLLQTVCMSQTLFLNILGRHLDFIIHNFCRYLSLRFKFVCHCASHFRKPFHFPRLEMKTLNLWDLYLKLKIQRIIKQTYSLWLILLITNVSINDQTWTKHNFLLLFGAMKALDKAFGQNIHCKVHNLFICAEKLYF